MKRLQNVFPISSEELKARFPGVDIAKLLADAIDKDEITVTKISDNSIWERKLKPE